MTNYRFILQQTTYLFHSNPKVMIDVEERKNYELNKKNKINGLQNMINYEESIDGWKTNLKNIKQLGYISKSQSLMIKCENERMFKKIEANLE